VKNYAHHYTFRLVIDEASAGMVSEEIGNASDLMGLLCASAAGQILIDYEQP